MQNIPNKMLFENSVDSSVQEDTLLWESIKKSNELAFSSLFKKLVNPLYQYGMHLFSDTNLAKDCIQELFASLWHKRETLSDVIRVKSYLFKSYRNLLFAKVLERKRIVYLDFMEEVAQGSDDSKEREWISEEDAALHTMAVDQAIQSLTRRQREALILRYYQNLDSKQTSEVMGISVEAVHNLVSKAIHLLRERMPR